MRLDLAHGRDRHRLEWIVEVRVVVHDPDFNEVQRAPAIFLRRLVAARELALLDAVPTVLDSVVDAHSRQGPGREPDVDEDDSETGRGCAPQVVQLRADLVAEDRFRREGRRVHEQVLPRALGDRGRQRVRRRNAIQEPRHVVRVHEHEVMAPALPAQQVEQGRLAGSIGTRKEQQDRALVSLRRPEEFSYPLSKSSVGQRHDVLAVV